MENLQLKNQALEADRLKALERSTHTIDGLIRENQEIRTQLATLAADRAQLQAELDRTKQQYLELLETSASRVKELQAKQNPAPAIEPIDPYVFLDWLKGLIKGKSRKPPQWEPTKADVEAILERARQP